MTATEFLKSKNLNSEGQYTHIPTAELEVLLEEYHARASDQKIDVDRKFVNLTEKYEKEKNQSPIN